MDISLPYGRSRLPGRVPEWAPAEIVLPQQWKAISQEALVLNALERPIGGPRLRELARDSRSVTIVVCDKTRGVPSAITVPLILEELRSGGIDAKQVVILVATGLHKDETSADIKDRLGSLLLERLRVSIHDSDDQSQLVHLGKLASGTPLHLNRLVTENDLVILEGNVEPHFFAGFTGGSKVILPGTAGTETILRNHSWRNLDHRTARYGMLDNPVRAEANEALRHLGRVFALNLVLDGQKRIVHATAGDPVSSFDSAAKAVSLHSSVEINDSPDIVITTNGGYPLDRNLYQCVKGIAVPEAVLHHGSRIIMVGECVDGVGHQGFLSLMKSGTAETIYERLSREEVMARDQWQAQVLCRILRRVQVSFVTRPELAQDIESMHMEYAQTIEQAFDVADLRKGDSVLVVPEGPKTLLSLA